MDLILDWLILLLAMRFSGTCMNLLRAALGALAGAAWALLCRNMGLSAPLLWLPGALLMLYAACGQAALRRPLQGVAVLIGAGGLLGGLTLAFCGATGSAKGGAALGCALSCLAVCVGTCSKNAQIKRVRMICQWRGNEASFDGLVDTGNSLVDYLTGLPVIVLPQEDAAGWMMDKPLRPIFADTAGGRQMMSCFVPDKVILVEGGTAHCVRAAAALSPGLCRGSPALVPATLVRR